MKVSSYFYHLSQMINFIERKLKVFSTFVLSNTLPQSFISLFKTVFNTTILFLRFTCFSFILMWHLYENTVSNYEILFIYKVKEITNTFLVLRLYAFMLSLVNWGYNCLYSPIAWGGLRVPRHHYLKHFSVLKSFNLSPFCKTGLNIVILKSLVKIHMVLWYNV